MKKDFRPILLYFIGSFISIILATFILGRLGFDIKDGTLVAIIGTIILYIGLSILLIIIYRKRLLKDIKRLSKKDLLLSIFFGLITIAINIIVSNIIPSESENQTQVVDLVVNYRIIGSIAICMCAPLVEELLFRYSLDTIINNKIVFLIVSSLLFGIAHAIDLNVIIYIYIGFMLALSYIKTNKNIISPMIVHFINNALSIISIFM